MSRECISKIKKKGEKQKEEKIEEGTFLWVALKDVDANLMCKLYE